MSKSKIVFAILFILGISLLNVAVLIEASNHENQLSIGAFEQQPLPAARITYPDKACNNSSKKCTIDKTGASCVEENDGRCYS